LGQGQIVGLLTPNRLAIAVFVSPSAEATTICARRTLPCGTEWERLMRSNSSRSLSIRRKDPILWPADTFRHLLSHRESSVRYYVKPFAGHNTKSPEKGGDSGGIIRPTLIFTYGHFISI
jgi:hypothetical protein